jgi:Fur family ferric uptake transcriptional regulator
MTTNSRHTRQRSAIRAALEAACGPLSPTEILDVAQAEVPGLGIATVYRTINQLAAAGEVSVVTLPGESDRYEIARRPHHHHFQCVACRRVYDIDGCPGDLRRLAPRGFSVEHHDVTLYGRCADCRRAA